MEQSFVPTPFGLTDRAIIAALPEGAQPKDVDFTRSIGLTLYEYVAKGLFASGELAIEQCHLMEGELSWHCNGKQNHVLTNEEANKLALTSYTGKGLLDGVAIAWHMSDGPWEAPDGYRYINGLASIHSKAYIGEKILKVKYQDKYDVLRQFLQPQMEENNKYVLIAAGILDEDVSEKGSTVSAAVHSWCDYFPICDSVQLGDKVKQAIADSPKHQPLLTLSVNLLAKTFGL